MVDIPVRWIAASILCSASLLVAQGVMGQESGEGESGIPVRDPLVIEKCGACHTADSKGNLERISWERATPEGWMQAIKRMVRLNGLVLTPAESRSILRYLATYHGLAPEEAKPVMYLAEHRIRDETNIPNEAVRGACTTCHAFAQPLSWRRSGADWKLLENLHVALYSQADANYRRPDPDAPPAPPAQPGQPPAKVPTQGEVALAYLTKAAPLNTPEWSAWRSRIHAPRLAGTWAISASAPGHGRYAGELVVTQGATPEDFQTRVTLRSLSDGSTITRTGSSVVYGGYAWRGTSQGGAGKDAKPDDPRSKAREVLWFSPDEQSAEGRWFWGTYNEFGFDVTLTRVTSAPVIASVMPYALKAGVKGAELRIVGSHFPAQLTAADLSVGAGVTVDQIVSHNGGEIVARVSVAPDAVSGERDVGVAGAVRQKAFPVYHRIDYLKVTPETSLAHLGSATHPKGFQQFEAIGFENGPDGKPGTADDLPVGPVDANWSVQEFMAVYNDDDRKFVGTLSPTAFFTPASDGPNPARKFSRNNYGDVWVVATAKTEKDKSGKPLSGRSYLVVTVPTYLRWDQPEVGQ